MPLITRVSRLFKADLHAVLDRIEEPDILLRQAVREMEETYTREEQQFRLLSRERQRLCSREETITQSLRGTEDELDLCFDSGKEQLARKLIRQQLETKQIQDFLREKRTALEQTLTSMGDQLEENRCRLESMRQKVEALCGEQDSDQEDELWSAPVFRVNDEAVEVAFLREKKNRSRS